MFKPLLVSLCLLAGVAGAVELTDQEMRWLKAAGPVLAYAQQIELPIEIIVQPQAKTGDVPLAAGFRDGRCLLVLSLRGNANAESVLAKVAQDQRGELIEAMAAHEVAHCWRYAQGAWHALPAGFVEVGEETAPNAELLAAAKEMRETRREEGYADLVALAWTHHRHPANYARVYDWLAELRADQPVARGGHDTRAWVRLARDPARFGDAKRPFEDAAALWREGLLSND
ncbi:NUDIX hydrolase [Massilia horti]|uniref:NUDIX hydrolase n=1 Tax=Massilia horti TaxID=2562153 RepID=A0A4Y9T519_9BURK|nr:NUDIX hydrolase [Massilia horti]TFW33494.1 NUDIX hydrolase [Massilia horti]